MCDQVKKTCKALQISAQVPFLINDTIEVINRFFIITAAKIEACDLVIKYQDPMCVKIKTIFFQHIFQEGNQSQTFGKCSSQEVQVDPCCIEILICQYPVVLILFNIFLFGKLL